jgi:hypothetical protein
MVRAPLGLLGVGLIAIATAYGIAFLGTPDSVLGPACLAAGATAVLTAILWLAARRRGRVPQALGVVIAVVAVATIGGFVIALWAAPPAADGALLLGLPRATVLMLGLTGLVPLVVFPLAYALLFDRYVMPRDE